MGEFVLAIDQGTTGSTVALMDSSGVLRASVNHEFPQIYPRPGWVEHRPADIWASVEKGIRANLRKKLCKPTDIVAIGITNQRETSLLWDRRSGEALNNAVVWQCRRTTDFCESLRAAGHEKTVRRKTGLVLDPYFSASKYRAAQQYPRHWAFAQKWQGSGGHNRQLSDLAPQRRRHSRD